MKSLTFIFIIYSLIFCSLNIAAAVEINGDLVRDYYLRSGEEITGELSLINRSNEKKGVRLFILDYCQSQKNNIVFQEQNTNQRSNANWVKLLTAKQVVIEANAQKKIQYNIKAPDDLSLQGSFWSIIIIEQDGEILSKAPQEEIKTSLRHVIRYGIKIRTHLDSKNKNIIEIIDRELIFQKEQGYFFSMKLANQGDNFLNLEIKGEIYDLKGKFVKNTAEVNFVLYPKQEKSYLLALTDLNTGQYQVLIIINNQSGQSWAAYYTIFIE